MGAGKTTLGREAGERLGRDVRSTSTSAIEASARQDDRRDLRGARRGGVPRIEARLRARRRSTDDEPAVIALGGGAVDDARGPRGAPRARVHGPRRRRRRDRVARVREDATGRSRSDEATFRALLRASGAPLYDEVADATRDRRRRRRARRGRRPRRAPARSSGSASSCPATARSRSSPTRTWPGSTGWRRSSRSAPRVATLHELPPGEAAKAVGRGRAALARAAARPRRDARRARRRRDDRRRRLRGRDLPARDRLGRRADDARRPGRRGDRRQDGDRPPGGKNLVGAFHWPVRTVIDPALLETLPEGELAERPRRGRQDGPARGRAALGAAARRGRAPLRRLQGGDLPARPARPRRARRSSTSGTRSRTRSRPPPTSSCRTARRSRSACSPRCGSPAATPPSSRSELRARAGRGSTASAPGRRSRATRRRRAAIPKLVLLERPAGRGSGSSCRRPRSVPRSTR